jgi:[protein-PII] uridylyltransferase
MALDMFAIQNTSRTAYSQKQQLDRLKNRIEQTLRGRLRPDRELAGKPTIPTRTEVFTVAPRVLISNSASRTHSVIEINGRDRPGLLHDVTRELTDLNLQISSALITTYGERAVDVFYVKDAFGMQVTHERKLEQIRERLLEALSDTPAAREKGEEKKEKAPAKTPARKRTEKTAEPAAKKSAKRKAPTARMPRSPSSGTRRRKASAKK